MAKDLILDAGPHSRAIINGKDCEPWFQFTEQFVKDNKLDFDEAALMMLSNIMTQAALHDFQQQTTESLAFISRLMGVAYNAAVQNIVDGALIATPAKKDVN